MSQNLSSAAAVIGALRIKICRHRSADENHMNNYALPFLNWLVANYRCVKYLKTILFGLWGEESKLTKTALNSFLLPIN